MSKWFLLNLILFIVLIWKVTQHYSFPNLSIHIVLGLLGVLLFLYNWTRNAVFSTIRNVPKRSTKIKLAKLSKRLIPIHRWTGTIALIVILFHAFIILNRFGFSFGHGKMVIGLLALITLSFQVVTGWLRLYKPTGKLRYVHLYSGMTLFFLIVLHLVL